ncbi:hypothetical protein [Streptomyces sp. SBT349]|uniref:hypothetical protein n=1 Tax=Streptomyces sp. SBT349 TaxID=1580539 RepID=UPI00066E77BB|nr:hypothetical protein [Streptomyces sp. SBT349]
MSEGLRVPSGPIETCPVGFMPREAQRAMVLDALRVAGVELGAYDERIAEWLAGWDWSTVVVIASWLQRAHAERAKAHAEVLREIADLWMERSTTELPRDRMNLRYRAHELREMADAAGAGEGL